MEDRLRPAVPDDTEEILRLWRQLVGYHRSIEIVRPSAWSGPVDRTLRPLVELMWSEPDRYCGFVHEKGGHLLGFCRTALTPSGPCAASVSTLVVEDGRRSSGIGADLLHLAMDWCKSRGAEDVSVEVIAPNAGAARFYEREGFQALLVSYMRKL